ncbi:hypothetical protein GP486_002522 [Trichoglossum hirsutum]|uniref:Heterokaryon incompatibility domain-containing protein n=1 Tax=Trichoglossum hirsutum TaxID=265104 RepID=A0A9P8LEM9_9PEZI|nr:hypothetical protein GP486_002522 [Trichoglossum hirsutum]
MDHLPTVADPAWSPVEVPYLCKEGYDDQGFLGYPERRGWSTDLFFRGIFRQDPKSWEDTASFLQEWLYFGMLAEFLGFAPKSDDFIRRTEDGRCVITTALLYQYIDIWQRSFQRLPSKARKEYLTRIDKCRSQVVLLSGEAYKQYMLSLYQEMDEHADIDLNNLSCPLPFEVILSIKILGATLDAAGKQVSRDFRYFGWGALVIGSDPLTARMLAAGWCEAEVSRLMESCQMTGMYFASFFHRSQSKESHKQCTQNACIANRINETEYQTKHMTGGCMCSHLGPPMDQVYSILERGGLPLILLSEVTENGGADEVKMEVVAHRSPLPYVAISHVWSDGLGNVNSNTLPMCQLVHLRGLIRELYKDNQTLMAGFLKLAGKPVPLWMDTLCIPLDEKYRTLAISKMRVPFTKADRVLVLDSELQQLSCRTSDEESIMRLGCSGWMRRMWTLQEGRLAKNLYAKFADGFVDLRKTMWTLTRKGFSKRYGYQSISLEASNYLWELSPESGSTEIEGFRGRSTSKPEDFPLCLASLLGLDTAALLNGPKSHRMKKLFLMQKRASAEVLLLKGPRMLGDGNRWVPLSLEAVGITTDIVGVPHSLGLKVSLPGFIVDPPGVPRFPASYPKSVFWRYFIFEDTKNVQRQQYLVGYDSSSDLSGDETNFFSPGDSTKYAFILLNTHSAFESVRAVQVIVYQEKGGALLAKYDCRASIEVCISRVEPGSNGTADKGERQYDPDIFPDGKALMGTASRTGLEQVWIVG